MKNGLSYETSAAIMRDVVRMAPADLEAVGLSKADAELTFSNGPWNRQHIPTVMRVLTVLCVGVLEMQGIPKTNIPAEHMAAVIATCVAPENRYVACEWMANERMQSHLEMAYGGQAPTEFARATGDQLRALVNMLSHTDVSNFVRQEWANKFNILIQQAKADA